MDFDTLKALLELAARAPKSSAERLWLAALVEQVNAALDDKSDQGEPLPGNVVNPEP